MTLVVQTNVTGRIYVWLVVGKKIIAATNRRTRWHGSDRMLGIIDDTLRDSGCRVSQLRRIAVVRGPGAFTAVRTGLVVANTLGELLRVPVAGIVRHQRLTKTEVLALVTGRGRRQTVRPWYGKAPNITRPT